MGNELNYTVLVLNRLWQPVQTCGIKRAMKLLCLGQAKVVQTSGEEKFMTHDFTSWLEYSSRSKSEKVIHTVSLTLCVPEIIVLDLFDRMPKREVKFNRTNIFVRDHYTCQYCRTVFPDEQLNLDHVIPKEKGGQTTWKNIVTSCIKCNSKKANKLPKQANMFPMNEPMIPKWKPSFGKTVHTTLRETWAEFLK